MSDNRVYGEVKWTKCEIPTNFSCKLEIILAGMVEILVGVGIVGIYRQSSHGWVIIGAKTYTNTDLQAFHLESLFHVLDIIN